jgi:hypothetical protein
MNLLKEKASLTETIDSFISFEEMINKLAVLNSKDFILGFVYNLYNVKHCVDNIRHFNTSFIPYGDSSRNMSFLLFNIFFMCESILGYIYYIIKIFVLNKNKGSDGSNSSSNTTGGGLVSTQNILDEILGETCGGTVQSTGNVSDSRETKQLEQEDEDEKCISIESIGNMNTKDFLIACIIAVSLTIINILLFTSYSKRIAKKNYNSHVMDDNCFTMSSSINSAISFIEKDFIKNSSSNTFEINQVSFSISTEKKINLRDLDIFIIGDATPDDPFLFIVSKSFVDTVNFPKFIKPNNLYEVYKSLCEVLVAYRKCNSIFALSEDTIAFPWTNIIVYSFMIILCGLVIFYLASQYDFTENFEQYKETKYVKTIFKEVSASENTDNILSDSTKKDISVWHEKIQSKLENNKEENCDVKKGLFFTGGLVILALGGIIIAVIKREADSYGSSLYSSKLFTDKQCI